MPTARKVEPHPAIAIRRAGPDDAPRLLPMVEAFFAAADPVERPIAMVERHLKSVLNDDRCAVFVAEMDGDAIGHVAVALSPGLEFGLTAGIENLFVRPRARSRRVGSRLMATAMQWCADAGANEIFLTIAQQGEPGRQLEQLYLRLGFVPSRRRLMVRALR